MGERILVTGGAGFIGSNFIRMLRESGDAFVVNLDALTYAGNLDNLKDLAGDTRYLFVRGDIGNENLVMKLITEEGINKVINFAAETHVDRSITNPEAFIKTNVLAFQALLSAAHRCGLKRFVQVSTDEVYGSCAKGSFRETDPLHPSSPYSASKAAADLLVQAYNKTYGFKAIITRSANNYGPYQYPEKLIPRLIIRGLKGYSLPIYGQGENVREWLHVGDHCRALMLILERGKPGRIYNIGSGQELTNLEVAGLICQYLGLSTERIAFIDDRPGHDRRYSVDTTRLQKELGWSVLYTFFPGLADVVNWYRDQEEWWQPLLKEAF